MDWNDFNRELQNRVSDSGTRYMLGLIYERTLDMAKQIDANNEVLLALAETMSNMVQLSDVVDERVRTLHRLIIGERDGVSVSSVPLTNDDV